MSFEDCFHINLNSAGLILGSITVILLALEIRSRRWNPSRLPVLNDRKWHEFGYGKATKRYISDPEGVIRSGFQKGGDAFFLCTEAHFRLILGPRYADVIGADERFDLGKFIGEDFHEGIPGFEPIANIALDSKILQNAVKTKLARQTPRLVGSLHEEAGLALEHHWTENPEWHKVYLRQSSSLIVGQIVSRVFLGDKKLCRDPTWLETMHEFLENTFIAAHHLRRWPISTRKISSRFMPSCKKVRAQLHNVMKYLEPLLYKEIDPEETTALTWIKDASKGCAYDFATLQLTLALASLDTSTDLLAKTLCDLSAHPDLVNDIRKEIIEIIGTEGLTKSSLQRLYLLDSAMKESQRLRPLGYSNMERLAKETVVLPDGLVIPKGTAIMVSALHMMDSSVWPNGDKYDGYRFANLRRNSKNSLTSPYQLTSTSRDHMGFGHGKQACPGRHYAAIFNKIALCHILMKYDFNAVLPDEGPIELRGHNILPHSGITLNIRRRQEEISF